MFIEPDDDGTQEAAFRQRVLERLAAHGALAGVALGESFHRVTGL